MWNIFVMTPSIHCTSCWLCCEQARYIFQSKEVGGYILGPLWALFVAAILTGIVSSLILSTGGLWLPRAACLSQPLFTCNPFFKEYLLYSLQPIVCCRNWEPLVLGRYYVMRRERWHHCALSAFRPPTMGGVLFLIRKPVQFLLLNDTYFQMGTCFLSDDVSYQRSHPSAFDIKHCGRRSLNYLICNTPTEIFYLMNSCR